LRLGKETSKKERKKGKRVEGKQMGASCARTPKKESSRMKKKATASVWVGLETGTPTVVSGEKGAGEG